MDFDPPGKSRQVLREVARENVPRSQLRTTGSPGSSSTTADVGIFKSTLLPSFTLHTGLSVATYVASRCADRADLKDWNWPASQVLNAWWSAVGTHVYHQGLSVGEAWRDLAWSEKVLLGGVTVWGTRLFYRVVRRSLAREAGRDDPRYERAKAKERGGTAGFWGLTASFVRVYLPEALFLTLITLPFTLPFRGGHAGGISMDQDVASALRGLGIGLFGAGFTLETLADSQLASHQEQCGDLCRHGVWSIVRHPNYLGDILTHTSFALLNASNPFLPFNPLVLLGPLTNYAYLRFFSGDKETEASQDERYRAADPTKYAQLQQWRREKNSVWPAVSEVANPWTWVVLAGGIVGVVGEKLARSYCA